MKPRHLADIALLTLAAQFGAQSPKPPIIELRIAATKDHVWDRWRDGLLEVNTGTRGPSQLPPQ
ncbi:MAG: hypothetical protein IPP98_15550 [Gemmatimonadetes bacterium]|nr:hypothetical protein [Gemmatimonadota bacterium]MBP9105992.1 hypothetical protein [Gemmatimonadaceae bacterium]